MLTKEQVQAIEYTSCVTWIFPSGDGCPRTDFDYLKQTALALYDKLAKAEAELAELRERVQNLEDAEITDKKNYPAFLWL